MNKLSYEQRLERGFAKIDHDLGYLMDCFREVLVTLGEDEIARRLPWQRQREDAD
jgi:hypothetical protein